MWIEIVGLTGKWHYKSSDKAAKIDRHVGIYFGQNYANF